MTEAKALHYGFIFAKKIKITEYGNQITNPEAIRKTFHLLMEYPHPVSENIQIYITLMYNQTLPALRINYFPPPP
ncbi:hypothetical protein [Klebsiella sp. S69]|uniref:hypothetical protein n=1 Tax=Klebsiella sp. S69 TaxID=2767439 RepID=UPI001908E6D7|nr:hypothetical protein [Klebsiella sp. S69]MBK0162393.1 hypothetical protein [Klebsiella sp. S69]